MISQCIKDINKDSNEERIKQNASMLQSNTLDALNEHLDDSVKNETEFSEAYQEGDTKEAKVLRCF